MKFYLRRIPLTVDGYAYGKYGKYYGVGLPVYEWLTRSLTPEKALRGDYDSGELRALNRQEAKDKVCQLFPGAKFFR